MAEHLDNVLEMDNNKKAGQRGLQQRGLQKLSERGLQKLNSDDLENVSGGWEIVDPDKPKDDKISWG